MNVAKKLNTNSLFVSELISQDCPQSEVDSRIHKLTTLIRISEKVNESLIFEEVLDGIYNSFQALVPYDRLSFAKIDENKDASTLVTSVWVKSRFPWVKIRKGFSSPLESSSLEKIITSQRPRIINDLQEYYRLNPTSISSSLAITEGIRSSLTCPIIVSNKALGFLFFSSHEPNIYKDAHVDLYLQIAGQVANIFEKSQLYQELYELSSWKNKILGMAAHDLRAPLANIIGSLSMSIDERQVDWKVLEMAQRSALQMQELINNFLEASSMDAGKLNIQLAPVDIQKFMVETLETFSLMVNSNELYLVLERKDNLSELQFDSHRMAQALGNLISNAIKYSPEKGLIKVTTSTNNQFYEISVEDQGPGIRESEIKNIFEEFKTGPSEVQKVQKNTGLGLYIVKKVLEGHQGKIKVDSKPDIGTKFTLQIPLNLKSN
jgi:signal transduction histidine kinase